MLLFRRFLVEEFLHWFRIFRLDIVELDTEILQRIKQRNDEMKTPDRLQSWRKLSALLRF
jgi:hypothetical protein